MWPWLHIFTLFQKILLGFSPQLHMQSTSRRCLQVIPLWSAPLAPPTVPRNWSALVNVGWWLVNVKKSARVQLADQSHGPYISCCSHQNQHNLPCFGSSNSSVATFSGRVPGTTWALKQPAVIGSPWWWLPRLWASEPSGSPVIQGSAWCHNEHVQWPLGRQLERHLECPPSHHSRNWWWSTGNRWPKLMLMWSSNPFMTPTVSICGSTSPLKVVDVVELVTDIPEG